MHRARDHFPPDNSATSKHNLVRLPDATLICGCLLLSQAVGLLLSQAVGIGTPLSTRRNRPRSPPLLPLNRGTAPAPRRSRRTAAWRGVRRRGFSAAWARSRSILRREVNCWFNLGSWCALFPVGLGVLVPVPDRVAARFCPGETTVVRRTGFSGVRGVGSLQRW